MKLKTSILFFVLFVLCSPVNAVVNYEVAPFEINGVALLQDATNPKKYYYLPPFPRVSLRKDGGF